MYQSAIAKFDRKTGTFQTWSTPAEWDNDAGQLGHIAVQGTQTDGKVWIKQSEGNNIYRLDVASSTFENLGSFKDPRNGKRIGTYGLHSDFENNIYLLDFGAGNIVKIDAKTKLPTVYLTPTPDSRPRRGHVDAQDRLWFAEYQGNALGMFDPKTDRISEWKVPTPYSSPYSAGRPQRRGLDRGHVQRPGGAGRSCDQPDDRISLPSRTSIRRVHVDDRNARHALDRQHQQRHDRQGRAAGLLRSASALCMPRMIGSTARGAMRVVLYGLRCGPAGEARG